MQRLSIIHATLQSGDWFCPGSLSFWIFLPFSVTQRGEWEGSLGAVLGFPAYTLAPAVAQWRLAPHRCCKYHELLRGFLSEWAWPLRNGASCSGGKWGPSPGLPWPTHPSLLTCGPTLWGLLDKEARDPTPKLESALNLLEDLNSEIIHSFISL